MNENEIVDEHFGLVIKQVLSFNPASSHDFDDYVQAGSIGLLNAIRSYDKKKGPFDAWACRLIFQQILRHVQSSTNEESSLVEDVMQEEAGDTIWDYVPDSLTDADIFLLKLRIAGYTLEEIGEKYDKTRAWAGQNLQRIFDIIRVSNET